MPEHRPRTRLAAAVAASLVSLFVVVVGAAPSNAATARAGAVATGGSATQVGPVDAAATSDGDVVTLDLAGELPAGPGIEQHLRSTATTATDTGLVGADVKRPSVRGPPAR